MKCSHSAPNQLSRCFHPSRTIHWQAPQCRFCTRTLQMSLLLGNFAWWKQHSVSQMCIAFCTLRWGKLLKSSRRTNKTFCNKWKCSTFQEQVQKSTRSKRIKIQECPVVLKKNLLQDGAALYTFINTVSATGLLQNANLIGNCLLKPIRTFCQMSHKFIDSPSLCAASSSHAACKSNPIHCYHSRAAQSGWNDRR